MNEFLSPGLSGAVAGLGVAMPMGAMSVLLLQEALRHRRTAMAAAAGIATVDLAYAALATALGPWVASHVTPIEAWIRLLSATVLLSMAAHALYRSRALPAPEPSAAAKPGHGPAVPAPPTARPAPPASGARGCGGGAGSGQAAAGTSVGDVPASGARHTATARAAFGRYVALTAVNPTTALYFAALTTAQASTLTTPTTAAAFLTGVATASLLWQQTLVAIGAAAGRRISPAARAWTFRLGYGLVAAYALKLAFPLP
ncbi:LysE family transporter [Streptomyces sp. NBC_01343]|uniref:LysE family transporter n=1 Tax=Streptomyces sp. NBC_01343 TaxID=2903832 RepID=UPI002E150C66|nr:LysE family transporter [Streptomyces sp. NBC_01343]